MEVTVKLDNAVAAGRCPGDPDGRVHRVASGAGEDAALGARDGAAYRLRELGLQRVAGTISDAGGDLLADRLQHRCR